MSRVIETHSVNGLNEYLLINVLDEPGPGGANHEYQIRRWVTGTGDQHDDAELCNIKFQKGPIKEDGVNGVSNEALLAIVLDRLQGFQQGPYACYANQCAIERISQAMAALMQRTEERIARGVEGTSQL